MSFFFKKKTKVIKFVFFKEIFNIFLNRDENKKITKFEKKEKKTKMFHKYIFPP